MKKIKKVMRKHFLLLTVLSSLSGCDVELAFDEIKIGCHSQKKNSLVK